MEELRLKLSRYPRTEKPNLVDEWHELSNNETAVLTFEEVVTAVGEWGHSFCHGEFDGDIKYANFLSSQLLVLDFDNKEQIFHPAQALGRLHKLGLECNAIYTTFNDPTDLNLLADEQLKVVERYRMIFIIQWLVSNLDFFRSLLQLFYSIFPEADANCHGAQIWAGGKKVIYRNLDFRLSPMVLANAAHVSETENVKSKRKREKFAEKIDALPQDIFQLGDPLQTGAIVPKTTSHNNNLLQPAKNGTSPVRNFNWGAARTKCNLLDDFLGMKRKLEHRELFGLYTAMKRIEGGKKLWRDSIKQNPTISDEKIDAIGGWIDKWEEAGKIRRERPLHEYAPADDPACSKYIRLTDIHFGRQRQARKIKEHYHIPLPSAEWAFTYMFHQVKSEVGIGVYIFKCATGLGKTEELMKVKLDDCIIAVPTHRLKDELSRRMTEAGIKHIVIPEMPLDLPDIIRERYEAHLAIGSFNYANRYLRSLDRDRLVKLGIPFDEARSISIRLMRYHSKIDFAVKNTYPVLTTHKRAVHTDFPNHSTLIIDEDILETLGEIKTVPMRDVRLSLKKVDSGSSFHKALSKIVQYSTDPTLVGKELTLPQVEDGILSTSVQRSLVEDLLESGIRSEVISLLRAEVIVIVPQDHQDPEGEKQVHFIVRNGLPEDKKVIILSATADEFMYRRLFPRVEFFDLSVVELTGTGIQYSNRGFSRSSWFSEGSQKALEKISRHIGNRSTITYKGEKYQCQFKKPYMHFENIAGTDELKGKDIAVVGTPYKPYFFYLLWASFLGIEYDLEEADLSELTVEANGYEFNFMTFKHPDLQKIQFHFVEDSLIQAVGRARLIRTNATVEVFSRYPLPGFEQRGLSDLPDPDDVRLTLEVTSSRRESMICLHPVSGSMAS